MPAPRSVEVAVAEALHQAGLPHAPIALKKLHAGRSGADTYAIEGRALIVKLHPNGVTDLEHRVEAQRVAASVGVAPAVRAVSRQHRAVVSDLVHDRGLLTALQSANGGRAIVDLAQRLAQLHQCDGAGLETRSPLDTASASIDRAAASMRLPQFVGEAWTHFLASSPRWTPSVLCHLDMNPSNLLWDGDRVWLVDWETAGRGDPRADLATLVNMLLLQGTALEALLGAYAAAGGERFTLASLREARALAYLAYAAAFLELTTSPGPELTRAALPSLASCYGAMGRGELDLGNDEGRWQLAAANVVGYWALVG